MLTSTAGESAMIKARNLLRSWLNSRVKYGYVCSRSTHVNTFGLYGISWAKTLVRNDREGPTGIKYAYPAYACPVLSVCYVSRSSTKSPTLDINF